MLRALVLALAVVNVATLVWTVRRTIRLRRRVRGHLAGLDEELVTLKAEAHLRAAAVERVARRALTLETRLRQLSRGRARGSGGVAVHGKPDVGHRGCVGWPVRTRRRPRRHTGCRATPALRRRGR